MYESGSLIASRYRLISRVAIGGMGEVWVAEDQALHRKVATKLVKPEYAADPVFHERLLAEARAAASVDNPHVVDVYDVGSATTPDGDNLSYISMELLSGRSFVEIMRGGPLSAAEVADLLAQVGEALATAHDRGVVHRDIKPANLMRDASGRITVLDFGIARAADASALTAAGHLIGTALYISPEQVAGEAASGASDVYSLGVVAYQCVAGVPPFDAGSDVATALAHRDEEPPPLPASVPIALAAVITACLAKDPADRPSAREVAELGASLATDPATVGPTTAIMPTATGTGTATSEHSPTTTSMPAAAPMLSPVPAWLEWRRVGMLAGVAGVVILVSTLIGLAADGGSSAADRGTGVKAAAAVSHHHHAHQSGIAVRAKHYIGLTYAAAARQLTTRGLVPVATGDSHPTSLVVAVSPTGRLTRGQAVTLTLAVPGPPPHHAPPPGHAPKPAPPGHQDEPGDHG